MDATGQLTSEETSRIAWTIRNVLISEAGGEDPFMIDPYDKTTWKDLSDEHREIYLKAAAAAITVISSFLSQRKKV